MLELTLKLMTSHRTSAIQQMLSAFSFQHPHEISSGNAVFLVLAVFFFLILNLHNLDSDNKIMKALTLELQSLAASADVNGAINECYIPHLT